MMRPLTAAFLSTVNNSLPDYINIVIGCVCVLIWSFIISFHTLFFKTILSYTAVDIELVTSDNKSNFNL